MVAFGAPQNHHSPHASRILKNHRMAGPIAERPWRCGDFESRAPFVVTMDMWPEQDSDGPDGMKNGKNFLGRPHQLLICFRVR